MTDYNACQDAIISHLVITIDYIPEQQAYVARADRFPECVGWAETAKQAVDQLFFVMLAALTQRER